MQREEHQLNLAVTLSKLGQNPDIWPCGSTRKAPPPQVSHLKNQSAPRLLGILNHREEGGGFADGESEIKRVCKRSVLEECGKIAELQVFAGKYGECAHCCWRDLDKITSSDTFFPGFVTLADFEPSFTFFSKKIPTKKKHFCSFGKWYGKCQPSSSYSNRDTPTKHGKKLPFIVSVRIND